MRELGKLAELQPSALYVHFPSKEHVLAELARLGHEAHQAALREALLEAGSDPVAQLRSIVGAHARFHATYPDMAMVVNDQLGALSSDLAAPALALRHQAASLLLDVLQRGITLSRFSMPRIDIVAAAIGAMGMRIPYWYSASTGISVEDLAAEQAELALRMVGAGG
jgi:AcrR family transcriptional regulator